MPGKRDPDRARAAMKASRRSDSALRTVAYVASRLYSSKFSTSMERLQQAPSLPAFTSRSSSQPQLPRHASPASLDDDRAFTFVVRSRGIRH